MKLRYFVPLAAHIAPTVAIGFGYIVPGSCITGVNALTVGFAAPPPAPRPITKASAA